MQVLSFVTFSTEISTTAKAGGLKTTSTSKISEKWSEINFYELTIVGKKINVKVEND